MPAYIPQCGDVIWITLNHQGGHEQAGRRPAIVLSPGAYNGKTGIVILCPVTSLVKGYPFEVRIPGGLPVKGVILADQVKSLDWKARQAEWLCTLPPDVTTEVLAKLGVLLE